MNLQDGGRESNRPAVELFFSSRSDFRRFRMLFLCSFERRVRRRGNGSGPLDLDRDGRSELGGRVVFGFWLNCDDTPPPQIINTPPFGSFRIAGLGPVI